MKYSTKLSDTIHILIFIALGDDEQLSSTKIAESIKTNPAYVRQLMATLKNAGIVVNTQGHANAALAKSADKIDGATLIIIFFLLSLAAVLPLLTLSNMIHNGWQKFFLQPQHPLHRRQARAYAYRDRTCSLPHNRQTHGRRPAPFQMSSLSSRFPKPGVSAI